MKETKTNIEDISDTLSQAWAMLICASLDAGPPTNVNLLEALELTTETISILTRLQKAADKERKDS